MKLYWITPVTTVAMLAVVTVTADSSQAETGPNKFSCGQSQGVPATVAQTQRGVVPVIRWASNHFDKSGFTPEVRCQMVSERFQTYYTDDRLNFLTTGVMNKMPVICVAQYKGSDCSGLLFTLKPGRDPAQTLRNLLSVRDRASGPINESTSSRIYIDINQYLQTAPVEPIETTSQIPSKQQIPSDHKNMPKKPISSPEEKVW